MYAASSESRKQASRPASSAVPMRPERHEPRHLLEEALAPAEVRPGGRVEGRVDPARAERVDADALARVVARNLPREGERGRLGDRVRRDLRLREQGGVGRRDADRTAARGAQMRHRRAAHDRVRAHVDRERAIEIVRRSPSPRIPRSARRRSTRRSRARRALPRPRRRMPAKQRYPWHRRGTTRRRAPPRAHPPRPRRCRRAPAGRRAPPAAGHRRCRCPSHIPEPAFASPWRRDSDRENVREKVLNSRASAPIQPS